MKPSIPNNSDPLPLTQDDLIVVDSLLKDAIDSFNIEVSPRFSQAFDVKMPLDRFIIAYQKYRYQYFPSRNVNGQRVMTIVGFSTQFNEWKTKLYRPRDHYGMQMLELKINLSKKRRDNVRSGDFGKVSAPNDSPLCETQIVSSLLNYLGQA